MENEKRMCATCKNWQPGKTSDAMRALRLAVCRLLPRWEFLPPQGKCDKHAPATDKAVAARKPWLEG